MNFDEYKAKTHEIINEINDLCVTAYVTDQMTLEQVVTYYNDVLQRIYAIANYPENMP